MSGAITSGNPQAYLTSPNFSQQFLSLLPPGSAYGAVAQSLSFGVGDAFAGLRAYVSNITETEMVPATADQLLTNWQYDFGLPDCCSALSPTLPQQQADLVAKMQATGGQSASYFISLAANLGFPGCTTARFRPARYGDFYGTRYYTLSWRFVWQLTVRAPETGATELICRVTQYQPAYGVVIFNFTG
jgi:uncharacterized protein YmfQ (DUF2313 family)